MIFPTASLVEARSLLLNRPTVVELFAGVGGLSLGLEQAGFHVSVAVELEDQHGESLQERFSKLGYNQQDRQSGMRRLDPNGLSTTIRAGTTKDRGGWSAPRPVHPFQNRVLTTRECARLQSFPDWFLLHPTKWHGNQQVGNAVLPLLARAVGKHILSLLGIQKPTESLPYFYREDALVEEDIQDAASSGLSRKRVSQQVIHLRAIIRNLSEGSKDLKQH